MTTAPPLGAVGIGPGVNDAVGAGAMPPRVRTVLRMLRRAGYLYKNSEGSHHHFVDPVMGRKHTIAGNPSKELDKGAWEFVRYLLSRRIGKK
jgi:predicted RNA binding protein YcfA (HicA-like mRNA interferase family)